MKKITFIVAITAVMFSFKPVGQTTWLMDEPHAKLGFSITHLMISDVEGRFKSFDIKLASAKEDFSDAVVELSADAATINTDNDYRDKDLKSASYYVFLITCFFE